MRFTYELASRRACQMNIQTLALADEGASIGSKIEDFLLANLPDGLVNRLDVVRDTRDVLDRACVQGSVMCITVESADAPP